GSPGPGGPRSLAGSLAGSSSSARTARTIAPLARFGMTRSPSVTNPPLESSPPGANGTRRKTYQGAAVGGSLVLPDPPPRRSHLAHSQVLGLAGRGGRARHLHQPHHVPPASHGRATSRMVDLPRLSADTHAPPGTRPAA